MLEAVVLSALSYNGLFFAGWKFNLFLKDKFGFRFRIKVCDFCLVFWSEFLTMIVLNNIDLPLFKKFLISLSIAALYKYIAIRLEIFNNEQ